MQDVSAVMQPEVMVMLLPPVCPEEEMGLAAGLGPFLSHPDREVQSSPPT